MPVLIRAYILQVIAGFGLSAIFVGLLLWVDVMGLWSLIQRSDDAVLAVFLLWFFNGLVFGSIQFGIWVMGQAEDGPPSGGIRQRVMQPLRAQAKIRPDADMKNVRSP